MICIRESELGKQSFKSRLSNLSVVAGQKQTVQGMAGRARLIFYQQFRSRCIHDVVKLWEFMEF